jgi:hypothetical protein
VLLSDNLLSREIAAMFASPVLFSEMPPDPAWEAAFNEWHDQEPIPVRRLAPGFASAQRYRAGERGYLAGRRDG